MNHHALIASTLLALLVTHASVFATEPAGGGSQYRAGRG